MAELGVTPVRAPVQGSASRERGTPGQAPGTITWAEHLAIYAFYTRKYGSEQSAERIAERGGFGYSEIIALTGKAPATWVSDERDDIFYFGLWGRAGHFLWTNLGQHAPRSPHAKMRTCTYCARVGPWTECEIDRDGYERAYGQETHRVTGDGFCPPDPTQPEHVWRLVKGADSNGQTWTAIGCWDRTCDPRLGCKSVFIARGDLSADEVMALATKHFPSVWARIHGEQK